MFLVCHTSVLFIGLLILSLTGFFIDMKDYAGQSSFVWKAKVILCVETLYVAFQYYINIYRIDGLQELQKKEELTILVGIGTQQQLGYTEDEVNIFDSIFPYNFSIMFLLGIAIFTRYMGKPRIKKIVRRDHDGEEDVGEQGSQKSFRGRKAG